MRRTFDYRFERRRYGRTTFTWAFVRSPRTGAWLSLGDPFPCVRPAASQLADLACDAIARECEGGA